MGSDRRILTLERSIAEGSKSRSERTPAGWRGVVNEEEHMPTTSQQSIERINSGHLSSLKYDKSLFSELKWYESFIL